MKGIMFFLLMDTMDNKYAFRFLPVLLFVLLFPYIPSVSAETSFVYRGLKISPEFSIHAEYNDNVTLSSGMNEKIEDDIVLKFIPSVRAFLPYKDHNFSLGVVGDYRKGTSTSLSDLNMSAVSNMNLNFPGGLKISVSDQYTKTRFDQALFEEDDVSTSQSNTASVVSSYIISRRVRLDGEYFHKWEESESGSEVMTRYTDDFKGKLFFPVSRNNTIMYLSYNVTVQDYEDRAVNNYINNRYLIGLKWAGPSRFSLFAEGGYEELDYSHAKDGNRDNYVGNIGLDVKFTETTDGSVYIGRDVYENLVYKGDVTYTYSENSSVTFSAGKKTESSFASNQLNRTFESTRYKLQFVKVMGNNITANLFGAYILHKDSQINDEEQNDKVWIGRAKLSYSVNESLDVGAIYLYAKKNSNINEAEYKNNRFGIFANYIF